MYRQFIPMIRVLSVMLFMVGCTKVGPDYVRPDLPVPQQWNTVKDPALVPSAADIRNWWKVFDDSLLTSLVERAGQDNLDLRVAVARVNEARARLGIATGQEVPMVDTGAAVSRERSSEEITGMPASTRTRHSVGLDASWEIDLFGRVARSVEAETAAFQASEEDRNDVMITLYAEVARVYLGLRALQARLEAAAGNISSQREVLNLTRVRFRNGLATDLDVAQAEQVLANSEAEVPPLRIELARAVNTLAVLLGQAPGALHDELSKPRPIPIPPESVTVGLPADLLRRRPDIRRAERQLAAQTARVGVATADLYPSLSLTGSFDLAAFSLGDLFNAGSRAFAFGPSLRWNIFDGGRVRGKIRVEDARAEQALLLYERTILDALNEVENAMTAYLEQRIQFDALHRSVKASRRALNLSTKLYKDGLKDFQNVLDAQRSLFAVENRMAEAKGNAAINLVRLYKAIGGGWAPDGAAPAATPQS